MEALILAIALNSNIDPDLLKAVCFQESKLTNVNTPHDGHSTSYGPCQSKSIAMRQVAMNVDLTKVENSIKVASKYLKYGIEKCGSKESGVGFYNTAKCLKKFKKNGYVEKVMLYYSKYLQDSKWDRNLVW